MPRWASKATEEVKEAEGHFIVIRAAANKYKVLAGVLNEKYAKGYKIVASHVHDADVLVIMEKTEG